MTNVIRIIKILLMKIFSLLPDSPFQQGLSEMDTSTIPSLNWFLPLDICANITLAWLACLLVYYIFMMVKNLIYAFIKSKLVAGMVAVFFGV